MPKCKIVAEPVRHKGRDYNNGEILEAPTDVITSLVSIGVAVRVEDVPTVQAPAVSTPVTPVTPVETPQPPTTSSRRRKAVEPEDEVVE